MTRHLKAAGPRKVAAAAPLPSAAPHLRAAAPLQGCRTRGVALAALLALAVVLLGAETRRLLLSEGASVRVQWLRASSTEGSALALAAAAAAAAAPVAAPAADDDGTAAAAAAPSGALGRALTGEHVRLRAYALGNGSSSSSEGGGGSEGSASSDGNAALCVGAACTGARFFVMEPSDEASDGVVGYLERHEAHVRAAFAAILASERCSGILGGATPWCARDEASGGGGGGAPLVVDVGANAGFYATLAAALGARVTAIDPQPQCGFYVRAAASLSGLSRRVDVRTAYAAAEAAPRAARVRTRSGCWGTFPRVGKHEGERAVEAAAALGGAAQGEEDVPALALPALLRELAAARSGGSGVLLLKMDAEGAETALLAALEDAGILRERLVKNFLIEFNKIALGLNYAASPCARDLGGCYANATRTLLRAGYTVLAYVRDRPERAAWGAQAPIVDADAWGADGWSWCDIWAFSAR